MLSICLIVVFLLASASTQNIIPYPTPYDPINFATTSVGSLLFFAGGEDLLQPSYNDLSSLVYIYDTSTSRWSNTSLSVARTRLAATSVGKYALFAGGEKSIAEPYNTLDIYDTETGEMRTTNLTEARYFYIVGTSVGDLALFAGNGFLDVVNIKNNTSVERVDFPVQAVLTNFAATSAGNLSFFAGGSIPGAPQNESVTDVVFVFDSIYRNWSVAFLSAPRSQLASGTVGSYAIFGGGRYADESYSDVIDLYNIETGLWTTSSLSYARYGHVAVVVQSYIVFTPGSSEYNQTDIFDAFDPLTNVTIKKELIVSIGSLVNAVSDGTTMLYSVTRGVGIMKFCESSSDCVDSLFCTSDACVNNLCDWEVSACIPVDYQCTMICIEDQQKCVVSDRDSCNDGIFCNGDDYCLPNGECGIHEGNPCDGKTCFEDLAICIDDKKKTNVALIVGIVVPLCVLLIASAAIAGYLFWRRNSRRKLIYQDVELKTIKGIEVQFKLGGGNFGDVYKGDWNGTPVALKKLKNQELMEEFTKEAGTLQGLQHPNIVQYLGTFEDDTKQIFIVTEYIKEGSLSSYIVKNQSEISEKDLVSMARSTAAGMAYLEQEQLVHRDLALRNLLIALTGDNERFIVKIGDFGLSRVTVEGTYSAKAGQVPIKWTSPEALEYGLYTTKSDVWSFGIVLWELFSYGMLPYIGMTNQMTMKKVKEGYRLEAPENCPEAIYLIMLSCWNAKADERPTFKQLFAQLDDLWRKKYAGMTDNRHPEPQTNQSESTMYSTEVDSHYEH